ncbi:unnamed protein product [Rhizoctonia solani]|uniref:Uncharacterized protein n=1 Tax=Rhizoctonia solani TaxID=456999 RepID=A0A8H3B3E0_9AGAM|nr:unnamed protein product [Rhizoctonia solani]
MAVSENLEFNKVWSVIDSGQFDASGYLQSTSPINQRGLSKSQPPALVKMTARLPIELLDLVAQYSSMDTQARLSPVSRDVYFVSVRALYASIPDMTVSHTTKCLLTLSGKPEIACLVRSFYFFPSSFHALRAFRTLITRALGNMTNLHTLSLGLDTFPASSLVQFSFRLRKLVYTHSYYEPHPVSQLLSTQPTIEELTLLCPPHDISTLDRDALPALKKLSAPIWLLPKLLLSRMSRLTQLRVIGNMAEADQFFQLGALFKVAEPPDSLELAIGMDATTHLMITQIVSLGLALIGLAAPFISSLRVDIHQGYIQQDKLQNMFAFVLPRFPNLKTLVVMSLPPPPSAHTSDSPRTRLLQARPETGAIASLCDVLRSMSASPVDTSILFPTPQVESDQTPSQQDPILDPLYDKACQLEILKVWYRIHPKLERVLFPGRGYIFTNEECERDD